MKHENSHLIKYCACQQTKASEKFYENKDNPIKERLCFKGYGKVKRQMADGLNLHRPSGKVSCNVAHSMGLKQVPNYFRAI